MSLNKVLINAGLTNHQTEDYGNIASGKKKHVHRSYCDSDECCYSWSLKNVLVNKDKTAGPQGTMQTVRVRSKGRVFRKMKQETNKKFELLDKCPDCGKQMFYTSSYD